MGELHPLGKIQPRPSGADIVDDGMSGRHAETGGVEVCGSLGYRVLYGGSL